MQAMQQGVRVEGYFAWSLMVGGNNTTQYISYMLLLQLLLKCLLASWSTILLLVPPHLSISNKLHLMVMCVCFYVYTIVYRITLSGLMDITFASVCIMLTTKMVLLDMQKILQNGLLITRSIIL